MQRGHTNISADQWRMTKSIHSTIALTGQPRIHQTKYMKQLQTTSCKTCGNPKQSDTIDIP